MRSEPLGLRDYLGAAEQLTDRALFGATQRISFEEIVNATGLEAPVETLRGKSILVLMKDQLTTTLALLEIDGVARRLILCPPDLSSDDLSSVIAKADVDLVIADGDLQTDRPVPFIRFEMPLKAASPRCSEHSTEWVLMTSATTGAPKMVVHNLTSLTAAIKPTKTAERIVWGTFYDIRRYGGLQIFLRAIVANDSMVLSSAGEPTGAFLRRLGMAGITHLSGTPSHWRRALMSGATYLIAPRYIRLSGEIADQAILDNLSSVFPNARIAHAYASTEAGVAFEVDDGLAGFHTDVLRQDDGVKIRIEDGSLRVSSSRMAKSYLGTEQALFDADGFIDTGDMLVRRGDRFYFTGRRTGIINVGGLKVCPEEVEGVINRHRNVQMSLVRARKNPITGALVVADVVLKDEVVAAGEDSRSDILKSEILQICRDRLLPHKVPATIRFVTSLTVSPSGKLARTHA